MNKQIVILLLAWMLGVACVPSAPAGSGADAPRAGDAASAAVETAATAAAPRQPALVEQGHGSLSLKKYKNALWTDESGARLAVYGDGAAYLFTAGEVLRLQESGDGFLLKNELYRTPFDAEPTYVLDAGAVRIALDGETLTFAVTEDPLGALARDGLSELKLTKAAYGPTRYSDFNFFSGPLEPGTDWFCYSDTGERRYAKWNLTVGEDGAMTGTLSLPDGRKKNCTLLGNGSGFALMDVTVDPPELLLYGQRTKLDADALCLARYDLVYLSLDPIFDPLDLCAEGGFRICRETKATEDLAYILGRSLDTVTLALLRDGWTETRDMETQYPALEGWFARLTKDGQTLLIHYDYDFSAPYEQYQFFPDAFVLYGADGAVLQWAGSRPLDHGRAEGYRLSKGTYFDPGPGAVGLVVGEDSEAFFLDDGRVAVETTEHEGAGDAAFELFRVIP